MDAQCGLLSHPGSSFHPLGPNPTPPPRGNGLHLRHHDCVPGSLARLGQTRGLICRQCPEEPLREGVSPTCASGRSPGHSVRTGPGQLPRQSPPPRQLRAPPSLPPQLPEPTGLNAPGRADAHRGLRFLPKLRLPPSLCSSHVTARCEYL